jgi:hypothetical protein
MLMKEEKMSFLKSLSKIGSWIWVYIVITAILSIIFGVIFFSAILDSYGVWPSLFWTLLGIFLIWIFSLLKAYIIESLILKKRREKRRRQLDGQP